MKYLGTYNTWYPTEIHPYRNVVHFHICPYNSLDMASINRFTVEGFIYLLKDDFSIAKIKEISSTGRVSESYFGLGQFEYRSRHRLN
jgi:hypothetical protein